MIARGNSINDRRTFLEDFAKKNNFDPLVPNNWESPQLLEKLKATKVIFYIE